MISRGKWILGAAYDFFFLLIPYCKFLCVFCDRDKAIRIARWKGRQSILKEKWQRASWTTFPECRWHLRWNLELSYSFSIHFLWHANKKEKTSFGAFSKVYFVIWYLFCMHVFADYLRTCKKFTFQGKSVTVCWGDKIPRRKSIEQWKTLFKRSSLLVNADWEEM